MRQAQAPRIEKRQRYDAKELARIAARWQDGAKLIAAQPLAPESYAFVDAQMGIAPGDLKLLRRVVLDNEPLNEAAAKLGIVRDEAQTRLQQALTGLAEGYAQADKPRPGERSRCRCAYCGGVIPATNAA